MENLPLTSTKLIDDFNQQTQDYHSDISKSKVPFKDYITYDSTRNNWSRSLINRGRKNKKLDFDPDKIVETCYRPFVHQYLYFDRALNEMVQKQFNVFPNGLSNIAIQISGTGASKDFSSFIVNKLPNLDNIEKGQAFPLYWYDKLTPIEAQTKGLKTDELIRRDAISDWYLEETQKIYKDQSITKEDIFYYIYGILHSNEYREKFASDLKKSLPRIPFVKNFWGFSKAGRQLADLHLNYESIEPYPGLEESGDFLFEGEDFYKVRKMRFGKTKGKKDTGTIIYNDHITLSGIPEKAYEYVVNGRSAIEWIMEQYQVKTDKASDIVNDPNDWAEEVSNERYILDLLKSIVNVSVQTVDIVNSLPALDIIETEERKQESEGN